MSRSHDPAARGGVRAARPADDQEPRDWRFGGAPQRRDPRAAAPTPAPEPRHAAEPSGWPSPASRHPAPAQPGTSYAPQFDRYASAFETQRQATQSAVPPPMPEPATAHARGATGRAGYRSPYGGSDVPPPVPVADPAPAARASAPRPVSPESGWSRGSWREQRAAPAPAAPQHWEPAPPEPAPIQQYAEEYAEGTEPQFGEPETSYYEPAAATKAYDPSHYAGGHYGAETAYRGEAAYDPDAYPADRHPDDPVLQPLESDAGFEGHAGSEGVIPLEEEAPRRSRRGLMVIGALVAAIAVGGGLGAVYKMTVAPSAKSGKAAVVKADKKPVKSVPEDEEGLGLGGTKKSIYDRVGGGTSAEDESAGAVVSGEEEPVARPETAESGLPEMPGIALAGPTPGSSAGEEDIVATGPRKVATVVVKPGETITAAGEEAEVATADAETVTPEEAVAVVKSKAKKELAKAVEADVVPEVPVATTASKSKTKTKVVVATAEDATAAEADVVPVPAVTGKKAKKSILPEVPAEDDATASAPKAATPAASGANGYVVQVKATKTRMEALGAYADMQQRFGGLLGSSQPDIQEVDLGAKGKWFRLRIGPPASKSAAGDLCGKLKGSGLKECLVSPY